MPDQPNQSIQVEKTTLEKLLFSILKEQRARRRWSIFFKFLFFGFLVLLLASFGLNAKFSPANKTKAHLSLIDVRGVLDDSSPANADNINESLHAAFEDKNTQAVILRINSPGGSPVQASQIYQEIHFLHTQHPRIPIYAVCTDVCASGAYYIASACENIYADPSSLVGSIGVLMNGFGFVDTMKKLGIQRRLLTAGTHKGFLDPFSPVKPEEKKLAENMINEVHQQFITAVKKGRGKRLKNNPELFSGLAWTGQDALSLGLIDGFANLGSLSRQLKNKNIVDYTVKPGLFEQLSNRMGSSFAEKICTQLGISTQGFKE